MGPIQPGIECSFCPAYSEVGYSLVVQIHQPLTTNSWDLPEDVFAEGEIKPKKKSAKPKANGTASAAAADADSKKRAAAEVSPGTLFRRSCGLVFLTARPYLLQQGTVPPAKRRQPASVAAAG